MSVMATVQILGDVDSGSADLCLSLNDCEDTPTMPVLLQAVLYAFRTEPNLSSKF